jgi:hypothetical protein
VEAKVDIRKLQLLNDRIAQVMDALNQVRLSVHGLSHAGAPTGQGFPFGGTQQQFGPQQQFGFPQTPYGSGQPMGFQHSPYPGGVPGAAPFGQFGWQGGQQVPFGGPGLQHSPYLSGGALPFTQGPFTSSFQGGAQLPGWGAGAPWSGQLGGGLSHSPELIEYRLIEQKASDPTRILQTFPFCLAQQYAATAW